MNSHSLLQILVPAVQSATRFSGKKRLIVMPGMVQVSGGRNLWIKPVADHQTTVC
jgi:hypothetical protein